LTFKRLYKSLFLFITTVCRYFYFNRTFYLTLSLLKFSEYCLAEIRR